MGPREMNSEMVVVVAGPSLISGDCNAQVFVLHNSSVSCSGACLCKIPDASIVPSVCKRWFPYGGSSFVGNDNHLSPFYLDLTSILPHFTPAQPAILNHALEAMV